MDVNTHEETATGRLFLLLSNIDGRRGEPNVSLQDALAAFYGLGTADLPDLMRLAASATALPDASENEVQGMRLPIPHGRFVAALDRARQFVALFPSMGNYGIGNVANIITEGVVVTIESASEALWIHRGDPGATPKMLRDVQEAVLELIKAVTNDPDLDPAARRLLMKYATELNTALSFYRAFGFDSLREWEERFLGAMVLTPGARAAAEKRPKIIERVLGLFRAVNTVATATHAGYVVGTDAASFAALLAPPHAKP